MAVKFPDFTLKAPVNGDFLVGYKEDGSEEFRTTTENLLNAANTIFLPLTGGTLSNNLSVVGEFASNTLTVGGTNTASGENSIAIGNLCDAKFRQSVAMGYKSVAAHQYTFIWSGEPTIGPAVSSTRNSQFVINAPGGTYFVPTVGAGAEARVGIGTDAVNSALTVVGDISASGTIYGLNIGEGGEGGGSEWVTAPGQPDDNGVAGQKAYDNNYLYICVATNTWRRTILASW